MTVEEVVQALHPIRQQMDLVVLFEVDHQSRDVSGVEQEQIFATEESIGQGAIAGDCLVFGFVVLAGVIPRRKWHLVDAIDVAVHQQVAMIVLVDYIGSRLVAEFEIRLDAHLGERALPAVGSIQQETVRVLIEQKACVVIDQMVTGHDGHDDGVRVVGRARKLELVVAVARLLRSDIEFVLIGEDVEHRVQVFERNVWFEAIRQRGDTHQVGLASLVEDNRLGIERRKVELNQLTFDGKVDALVVQGHAADQQWPSEEIAQPGRSLHVHHHGHHQQGDAG